MKILIYADVDMNLIDGSSIWLNSFVQVLAGSTSNQVYVLLKSHRRSDLLLQDLLKFDNVILTDPFKEYQGFDFKNKNRLTPDDALKLISEEFEEQSYNCVILRGLELCKKAFASFEKPEIIVPYITDFSHNSGKISKAERSFIQQMYSQARLIFLQTAEMKTAFLDVLEVSEDKIAILPPMVPNFPKIEPSFRNKNSALVYVGKFSNDYFLFESLEAFKKTNGKGYKFNIAGDKFHLDLKVPKEKLIQMMDIIPNVNWQKALNRENVSLFIESSDLGLCWRSKVIDNEWSMELSTKLLEYGRLGKPVLVRQIPIHERLLGIDYPFYVDTEEDLIKKIKLAFSDAVLYEKAARKVYEVSLTHSFSNISQNIKPYLAIFAHETVKVNNEKKSVKLLQFMKRIHKKIIPKTK